MKNLKRYTAIILLAIVGGSFLSCDNDDDSSGTDVKYVLTMQGTGVAVTSIMYRNSAGNMVEGFGTNETDNNWSKTVSVQAPFNASFQMTANNTGDDALNYTMAIYVDGTAVSSEQGSVPPQSGIITDSLTFDVTE